MATTKKNQPVAIYKANGDAVAVDLTESARSVPVGELTGFGFSMAALAPVAAAPKTVREPQPIEWPADVRAAAASIGMELPAMQPSWGLSASGTLQCRVKTATWAGADFPTLERLTRREVSRVWAVWLSTGCGGQVPSMANGEQLSLVLAIRSLIGSGIEKAAFRKLWTHYGDRTTMLGQLSCHTNKLATLDLNTFNLILT